MPLMLTIPEVVNALTCSRTEFGKLFLQAQVAFGIDFASRIQFETLAVALPDDRTAFTEALTLAQDKGFFEAFVELAADKGFEKGAISQLIISRSGNAELQAIVDPGAGFTDPVEFSRKIHRNVQLVGKVYIQGASKGTGFLIMPNLFLTAWHVVKDMFVKTKDAQGKDVYRPQPNPPQLEVEFNNFLDSVRGQTRPAKSVRVEAHKPNWYVMHSACHDTELDEAARQIQITEGYWDYAIIRLARAIGLERRYLTPDSTVSQPQPNDNILLFQHPAGVTLKMDQSKVVGWVPQNAKLRFLHTLNTTNGSSGGPCFNTRFDLVGIHQGAWPEKVGGAAANRGIPIQSIISSYTQELNDGLPEPDPSDNPVWKLDKITYFQPVIGCDSFQSALWRSAIGGEKKLISINGDPYTGKSFLIELASHVLTDADHLKIALPGENITKKSALELVEYICSEAGANTPQIIPFKEYNAAPAAWLKDEVMVKLMEVLASQRADRIVWVLLSNLNNHHIEGEHASDLLYSLYLQVLNHNWLRIVLDGQTGPLPAALTPLTEEYETEKVVARDLELFLSRACAEIGIDPGQTLSANARMLHRVYSEEWRTNPANALPKLAQFARIFIDSLTTADS